MNWEEEVMLGINQMKKYQKTKRIQAREEEKKAIRKTIILNGLVLIAYFSLIYFGGQVMINRIG